MRTANMHSTIDSQGYERINTYDVNEGDIISFNIHKRKWFEWCVVIGVSYPFFWVTDSSNSPHKRLVIGGKAVRAYNSGTGYSPFGPFSPFSRDATGPITELHHSYDIYSRCPGYHDQDN